VLSCVECEYLLDEIEQVLDEIAAQQREQIIN
jgi:hypothetical protein